jgi:site-specific recombinase XerD
MLKLTLSQVIDGYLLDARARKLSVCTLRDYQNAFRHLQRYFGEADPIFTHITAKQVRAFFLDLSEIEVKPAGCASRPARHLSKKSLLNIHTALSALWTWALTDNLVKEHVMRAVAAPKPETPVIVAFSKTDVAALLIACDFTSAYTRLGKRECANSRPTALRDRALMLTLLDTGARASELCADPRRDAPGARLADYDQRNATLRVIGKGSKTRLLVVSTRTQKALWRYLATRETLTDSAPLFATRNATPLTSTALLKLCQDLGKRAGVQDCHPHRFRHTFAIEFLRNGGRVLELQQLLGHSTLQMVQHYATLAQADLDAAMKRASPVDNWRL